MFEFKNLWEKGDIGFPQSSDYPAISILPISRFQQIYHEVSSSLLPNLYYGIEQFYRKPALPLHWKSWGKLKGGGSNGYQTILLSQLLFLGTFTSVYTPNARGKSVIFPRLYAQ